MHVSSTSGTDLSNTLTSERPSSQDNMHRAYLYCKPDNTVRIVSFKCPVYTNLPWISNLTRKSSGVLVYGSTYCIVYNCSIHWPSKSCSKEVRKCDETPIGFSFTLRRKFLCKICRPWVFSWDLWLYLSVMWIQIWFVYFIFELILCTYSILDTERLTKLYLGNLQTNNVFKHIRIF